MAFQHRRLPAFLSSMINRVVLLYSCLCITVLYSIVILVKERKVTVLLDNCYAGFSICNAILALLAIRHDSDSRSVRLKVYVETAVLLGWIIFSSTYQNRAVRYSRSILSGKCTGKVIDYSAAYNPLTHSYNNNVTETFDLSFRDKCVLSRINFATSAAGTVLILTSLLTSLFDYCYAIFKRDRLPGQSDYELVDTTMSGRSSTSSNFSG